MGIAVSMFILGLTLLAVDFGQTRTAMKDGLTRNPSGKGSSMHDLEAVIGDSQKEKLKIEVGEQEYTKQDMKKFFRRCIRKIEKQMPGENESLDHVEQDLNLMTTLEGEPVEISWELSEYKVMNVYGEIQKEHVRTDGTPIELHAVLTYTKDRMEQARYSCAAVIYPESLSGNKKETARLKEKIEEKEKETREKKRFVLPQTLGQKAVKYYREMDYRGLIVIVMGILTGVLLCALEKQKDDEAKKERQRQMLLDYPEVLNKLTLYLGSGMTLKRAWWKIVTDYEAQREVWGERFVYEEMKQTCYEMESGIMESESYERFGRRCERQEYIRLGALLSQNLRKGGKGLGQLLKTEAIQAQEERKAHAKRAGEEAGTKLLLPMFLMLAVVLVIVIVPAFLSVQL